MQYLLFWFVYLKFSQTVKLTFLVYLRMQAIKKLGWLSVIHFKKNWPDENTQPFNSKLICVLMALGHNYFKLQLYAIN
jgi:hypothetical protein